MSLAGHNAESTRDTHALLEQARVLLLEPTPRNIDLCCTALSQAAVGLEASPARQVFRPQVETIARLLENAAAFHAGLFRQMQTAFASADNGAERAITAPRIRLSA